MSSVSQLAEVLQQVLNVEADELAREVHFIERERNFTGSDFAQSLICRVVARTGDQSGWAGAGDQTAGGEHHFCGVVSTV